MAKVLAGKSQIALGQWVWEMSPGCGIPHWAELELDAGCPLPLGVMSSAKCTQHCEAEGNGTCLLFTDGGFSKNPDAELRNKGRQGRPAKCQLRLVNRS